MIALHWNRCNLTSFPSRSCSMHYESWEVEGMVTAGHALASGPRRSNWELTLFPGVTIPPPAHQIRSDRERCGWHQINAPEQVLMSTRYSAFSWEFSCWKKENTGLPQYKKPSLTTCRIGYESKIVTDSLKDKDLMQNWGAQNDLSDI